jgi:hypothetical protein
MLEELLVKRDRSLIDQSLHSRQGATTRCGTSIRSSRSSPRCRTKRV